MSIPFACFANGLMAQGRDVRQLDAPILATDHGVMTVENRSYVVGHGGGDDGAVEIISTANVCFVRSHTAPPDPSPANFPAQMIDLYKIAGTAFCQEFPVGDIHLMEAGNDGNIVHVRYIVA